MDGAGIMMFGLILLPISVGICIFNEDWGVIGITVGMFVTAVGAFKFSKDEGLI